MARSLWNGSLSFGLVNVPVALYSAVRDLDVHFHELHAKDGARIEIRRFCSQEDHEVDYEEIGRGYDLDGKQVAALRQGPQQAGALVAERPADLEDALGDALVSDDDLRPDRLHQLLAGDHPAGLVGEVAAASREPGVAGDAGASARMTSTASR